MRKTVINKIALIQCLLSMRYRSSEKMRDHAVVLESQFAGLTIMCSSVDNLMKVVVLIPTHKDKKMYEPIVSSISIVNEEKATR